MLRIHLGNRFETLVDLLQADLAAGRGGPFDNDTVLVPSAAVGRALTLALADAQGLASNLQTGYLAHWLWQQMQRLLPGIPATSPFAPAALAWRVYAVFGDAGFSAAHPRLQRYLAGADALMRQQLAQRVAALFEPYSTYRPRQLAAWRTGALLADHPDEAWQAALWRRLCDELALDSTHPAQTFIAALRDGGAAAARARGLPQRVRLLAMPTMAPLHVELLAELGRFMSIEVYALNPCRDYWFELVDRRRLAHLRAEGRDQGHEVGHPLLAAWGRQTQAHIDTLLDRCGDAEVDDAHYLSADGDSQLARLQNSILDLDPDALGQAPPAEGDRSIELHVCHSLTRELEVLQDRLLGLFGADPGLRPGDILVTVPDLDAAWPLIDAVFGSGDAAARIPYAITGRGRSRANEAARCLLALLALASSRAAASDAFGLLQQPMLARRLGLDEDELAQLQRWFAEAGYRWGLDAAQREQLGLPPETRHTLADALARLFLGHAVPATVAESFGSLLPAGDAEGSRALPLGALWRFAHNLQALHDTLRGAHRPERWLAIMLQALDDFLAADADSVDDLRELRATLHELLQSMLRGGLAEALPLAVWQAALVQALDDPARGGVPTGRVTFAAMSSLRNLPFEVVALLGLDDGVFPAVQRPAEFDLMAAAPQRGDRQRRHDERNLFLDLLLSARRVLHLSHSGRSVRDNSARPPSVLVAELLDLLLPAGSDRSRCVVEHPLQPFSAAAFSVDADPRLRSHDALLAQALRASLAAPPATAAPSVPSDQSAPSAPSAPSVPSAPSIDVDDGGNEGGDDDEAFVDPQPPFFTTPLPEPDASWRQPTLDRLAAFFRHPSLYLLRHRLGLSMGRDDEALADDEPFGIGALDRHNLAQRLLPAALAGADGAALQRLAQAGVEWPGGALGAQSLDAEVSAIETFTGQLRQALAEPVLPPFASTLDFDLDGQAWQLQVDWADLRASGLLRWRAGRTRGEDRLAAWLQHLALCAAAPPGVAPRTCWLARDGNLALRAPGKPEALLRALLQLYRHGLCTPLPLFPESAWALASDGPAAAHKAWTPSTHRPYAEGADAAHLLAWRGRGQPLGAEFQRLALEVFAPLIEHLETGPRPS